jgi:carboxyl-terminal processing protease
LSEKNGVCSITQIITGSPCWKDGRLKNGDIIQKVAQADDEPVDIAGWDLEDIVSIIRGKEGSTVNLTVKHLDGSTEVIGIKRGRVETEATFAKSVIVETDAGKIGYILLPEFYADFNTRGGRRCAIDMKKEIEKLKEEKVNGIIIDLRYNGGGSLSDVVDIGGFFIDKGPIVQVKSKGLAAQPLFDESSGTVYDGPLAILINQGSASASEILAAAMQDYNRAIVLGTTSFGKGTVQRIFPLEEYFKGDASLLPFGSVKLTLQKFYRINGGSTQLKGVTPDITLPDLYEQIDMGERKDSNSLAWDQVAKADYKPIKSNANFAALIANSKSRIDANSNFKLIKQNAARLKRQYDDNKYPLNEKLYVKKTEENKALNKKIEELDKSKKLLTIKNPKVDLPKINMDTVSVSKNEEWLKLLRKDPYISEASNVLLDWMKLSKGQTVGMIEDKRKN